MLHSHYRAIASDFDGTLVNSDKAHTDARLLAYEQLAEELGEPRLANVDPIIHANGHHHGSNPHDINAWIIEQAGIEVDGVDVANEVVARKKAHYRRLVAEGLEPRPGAVEFILAALRCWQGNTMIATTAERDEVDSFLGKQGLSSSFTSRQIVAAEDVERFKPDPEVYTKVLDRLGLQNRTHQLLVIEDTPHGVEAANRAGAIVIGVLTPEHGDELLAQRGVGKPFAIAGDLAEVNDMLQLV